MCCLTQAERGMTKQQAYANWPHLNVGPINRLCKQDLELLCTAATFVGTGNEMLMASKFASCSCNIEGAGIKKLQQYKLPLAQQKLSKQVNYEVG